MPHLVYSPLRVEDLVLLPIFLPKEEFPTVLNRINKQQVANNNKSRI
jgi:hypothetical protein